MTGRAGGHGPGTPPVAGRHRLRGAAVIAAALALGGCASGGDQAPASSSPPTTPPPPQVFPLRGSPVDDPALATRPALVVKIDDSELARPQAGINDADVVFEEKVEGPISRLAAVYQSRQPAEVGPVRSGRTTDIAVVAALNRPLYAFSGANPNFLARLRAAALVDVGADAAPDAYHRVGDRPAPYNLWASPEGLRGHTPAGAGPPPTAFTFGPAPVGDTVADAIASYDFGPDGTRVTFSWDAAAGGYARTQNGTRHVDAEGRGVTPANVVVQLVEYVDTGERDVVGTPVPEARLVGEGDAWVLTRGVGVRAHWSRPDPVRPTEYRASDGSLVPLAPGQTWVALVPAAGVGYTVTRPDGTVVS